MGIKWFFPILIMFYYHPPKINNVQDRLLHENEIIENILYKIVLKADFIQLYLED